MDEGKITITTSRLKGGFFRKRIMSKDNAFNRYPPIIHGEAQAENDEFVIITADDIMLSEADGEIYSGR